MKVRALKKRAQRLTRLRIGWATRRRLDALVQAVASAHLRFFEELAGKFDLIARELPAEHQFQAGDYATRDGTDVQLVIYANDRYADFRCIKAPRTGWIGVGEVEHNGQWKYTPLTAEEARGMGAVLQAAPEPA